MAERPEPGEEDSFGLSLNEKEAVEAARKTIAATEAEARAKGAPGRDRL